MIQSQPCTIAPGPVVQDSPNPQMADTQADPAAPGASSLTQLIESSSASDNPLAATTLQILHNLQHQHLWTSLQIHNISDMPEEPTTLTSIPPSSSLPCQAQPSVSLISGIPPHRLYTHPDEQLYMLEKGLREDDLHPERMFVLPTAQGQSWTLRSMASVFAALPETNAIADEEDGFTSGINAAADKAGKVAEYYDKRANARASKEWGGKRLLLAMVDKGMGGDGTVAYYIVQEGEVKPRQN